MSAQLLILSFDLREANTGDRLSLRAFLQWLDFLSHPVPSSRPIVRLAPSLDVTPPAISVVQRDCKRRGQEATCLSAALCFQVTSRTPGRWDRRFCE